MKGYLNPNTRGKGDILFGVNRITNQMQDLFVVKIKYISNVRNTV